MGLSIWRIGRRNVRKGMDLFDLYVTCTGRDKLFRIHKVDAVFENPLESLSFRRQS